MGLPILISKKDGIKICPNDYKIGWLMQDRVQGLWMIWGSYKDLKSALNCARETIKKRRKRSLSLKCSIKKGFNTITNS